MDLSERSYFILNLIRHGETNENLQGVIQGQMDTKLNETGRAQARQLAAKMADQISDYHQIYASDLARAYETCTILVGDAHIERILTDQRLRERSFGKLQGHPLRELIELARAAGSTVMEYPAEGGESPEEVEQRVASFVEQRLVPDAQNQHQILLVSHGGVIRSLINYLARFASVPFDPSKANRVPPNTSINEFKVFYHHGKVIEVECLRLHDVTHLDAKQAEQALNQLQVNNNVNI